ncbi:HAD family hydrolase [Amedibacillus sp. YH-ame10]
MEKKYFFFDIDGTLTDGKSFMGGIPQSTKDAIQELKKNGHEVAIATGRPYVAAKVFAKDAGIENVVCNGGYTCVLNGEIIANKGMELKDCHHLMQECLGKDIPFLVAYQDDFVFYTHNDTFFTLVNRDEFHADVKVIDNFDYFACPEIFRMMIAIDRGYEDKIEHYGSLVPSRYHDHYVIVEPDDKYEGVLQMVKALKGNEKDIVVFGDGMNDVTMFQSAPISIAMGNGVNTLKELADFVTKRSDEDGIAFALKHFGWIS